MSYGDGAGAADRARTAATAVTGRGTLNPPVVYLPCRLDEAGELAEVLLVELGDGRTALLGYTALDRFVDACGQGHPWVLWRAEELGRLRELQPYDVSYLDVQLPAHLRVDADPVIS
jgi:hypothetical protein